MEKNDLINETIENEYFDSPEYLYNLETYDLPYECPCRQLVPFGPLGPNFGQQGPGFGRQQQGPGFGPQGPGFGPQGPGFGPQGPGFGPSGPGFGGQQGGPSSPPPNFTPSKKTKSSQTQGVSTQFVAPGTIRPCVFRFVYIWPTRGVGFWAWLTYVGRRSVSGFRWSGRRWVYFGMDVRRIDSFECY